jgi:hypothetical protein
MKSGYILKLAALAIFTATASAAVAGTAFLTGEQTSGMNKICYYVSHPGR